MLLVLMFVPPFERAAFLDDVLLATKPGGAIVVVDRTVAPAGGIATVMWRLTLAEKLRAGALPDEILAKELSLAGAQRPLPRGFVERFGGVEFFRYGDFAGWIVEKEE